MAHGAEGDVVDAEVGGPGQDVRVGVNPGDQLAHDDA